MGSYLTWCLCSLALPLPPIVSCDEKAKDKIAARMLGTEKTSLVCSRSHTLPTFSKLSLGDFPSSGSDGRCRLAIEQRQASTAAN